MIDIIQLIKNGKNIVVLNLGRVFDRYLEENKDEYHLLVDYFVLIDRICIDQLFKTYYIHEIFDLSNCYLGQNNERFMYWHLSKHKPTKIKVAVFTGSAHPYRDDGFLEGYLKVPDKFNDDYLQYIKTIENWIKTDSRPHGIRGSYECNEIAESEFDYSKPLASYYRKTNDELREQLRNYEVVKLKDVAEVIRVPLKDGGNDTTKVKSIDYWNVPSYPYVPELHAVDGFITTQLVHKGDILKLNKNHFFLIDKESDFELYAPALSCIIRAKSVCPEFLYLYLGSQTAQRIFYACRVQINDSTHTDLYGLLDDFPVIMPTIDENEYIEKFLKISSPNPGMYVRIEKYLKPKGIEQALNQELTERIRITGENRIKKQIEDDVSELNNCYANKSYKATIVLAGSILETFLIDWLSEMRGINYFETALKKRSFDNEKKKYVEDEHGMYIYENKMANLADYIDEIRDIKGSDWVELAKEAHEIRRRRNMVHVKLCLRETKDISDAMCKEVIDYLKNIIESRWKTHEGMS
jgi:hypothetical protein